MNHKINNKKHHTRSNVCIDINKPNYILSQDLSLLNCAANPNLKLTVMPKQMSRHKLLMAWFCKMANSVMGTNGKLLEY